MEGIIGLQKMDGKGLGKVIITLRYLNSHVWTPDFILLKVKKYKMFLMIIPCPYCNKIGKELNNLQYFFYKQDQRMQESLCLWMVDKVPSMLKTILISASSGKISTSKMPKRNKSIHNVRIPGFLCDKVLNSLSISYFTRCWKGSYGKRRSYFS